MKRAAMLFLLLAGPASAETGVALSPDDPRIGSVSYASGEAYDLQTVAETEHTVLLAADERIQTVMLGDPSTYSLTVSPRADSFSLRQLRASAISPLTIRTDKRLYQFMVSPAFGTSAPYLVRFTYSEPVGLPAAQTPAFPAPSSQTTYKINGNRDLHPLSIRDDGTRMYIQWAPSQALPAVFAVEGAGNEEIVNGYMRGAEFTVDRIYEKLIFRIDKASATAQRVRAKAR